jgi:hypothetical protein
MHHIPKAKSENIHTKEFIKVLGILREISFNENYLQLFKISKNMNTLYSFLVLNDMREELIFLYSILKFWRCFWKIVNGNILNLKIWTLF